MVARALLPMILLATYSAVQVSSGASASAGHGLAGAVVVLLVCAWVYAAVLDNAERRALFVGSVRRARLSAIKGDSDRTCWLDFIATLRALSGLLPVAIKVRNQCLAIIRARLNDGIDPELNGEYRLSAQVEPASHVFVDVAPMSAVGRRNSLV